MGREGQDPGDVVGCSVLTYGVTRAVSTQSHTSTQIPLRVPSVSSALYNNNPILLLYLERSLKQIPVPQPMTITQDTNSVTTVLRDFLSPVA